MNLAHNDVLVIDQPTGVDRDAADALVAAADRGQTVTCRYTTTSGARAVDIAALTEDNP